MAYDVALFSIRHPDSITDFTDWSLWRDTFAGGEYYRDRYLKKFSSRETDDDFATRKDLTPIPSFAKAAVLDIRNSIFQRLADISRIGGSKSFQRAAVGEQGGVDRQGSSMNSFIGIDVLTELLVMGRVGVYVDAPSTVPTTLATTAQAPYLYVYPIEDILSWTLEAPEEPGQFKAVLLRDHCIAYNTELGVSLPKGRETRYRLVWKDAITGKVHYKLMDEDKNIIPLPNAMDDGSVVLDIEVVPFVMPDIGDSLLKDVASYQKALLNLASSDVNWALKSNTPFLTIQRDLRGSGAHLRTTGTDATPGSQQAQDQSETVGAGTGRYYDLETDRPGFIAPPTAPLLASVQLQEKLEDDIRKLINLAVANKAGSRTESAEAKKLSSQGLEAGLSFIGLVLEQAEQLIATYWASYESMTQPQVAKVSYPSRYILKSDEERLDEAGTLLDLTDRLPGKTIKKTLAKLAVNALLSGKEDAETIETISAEIDRAGYTSSLLEHVLRCQEAGLVGDELASEALGWRSGEVEKAKKDRADRAIATLQAQQSVR